jgi:hypothetical protein
VVKNNSQLKANNSQALVHITLKQLFLLKKGVIVLEEKREVIVIPEM